MVCVLPVHGAMRATDELKHGLSYCSDAQLKKASAQLGSTAIRAIGVAIDLLPRPMSLRSVRLRIAPCVADGKGVPVRAWLMNQPWMKSEED